VYFCNILHAFPRCIFVTLPQLYFCNILRRYNFTVLTARDVENSATIQQQKRKLARLQVT
jgi:hypothetical protein